MVNLVSREAAIVIMVVKNVERKIIIAAAIKYFVHEKIAGFPSQTKRLVSINPQHNPIIMPARKAGKRLSVSSKFPIDGF